MSDDKLGLSRNGEPVALPELQFTKRKARAIVEPPNHEAESILTQPWQRRDCLNPFGVVLGGR